MYIASIIPRLSSHSMNWGASYLPCLSKFIILGVHEKMLCIVAPHIGRVGQITSIYCIRDQGEFYVSPWVDSFSVGCLDPCSYQWSDPATARSMAEPVS